MDMRLDCRSRKTYARRRFIVRWNDAAAGKKVLQLFEKLELAFCLQFLRKELSAPDVSDFAQRNSNKCSAVESDALDAS